jgi:hypothetical protein
MKSFSPANLSSFLIREKQCKFNRSCDFYSNSSYTCTHVGGRYCGKYRILLQTGHEDPAVNRDFAEEAMIVT